jgi:hypothetical protein
MDLCAYMVRQPVECAESRQAYRGVAKLFDCPIDQVSRVAHRFGCLEHSGYNQVLTNFQIRRNVEIGAHCGPVAIECLCADLLGDKRWQISQPELRCQILYGVAVRVGGREKTTEILAGLQQNRQRQATRIATGSGPDKGLVSFTQPIAGLQFFKRQSLTRTGVSGAVHSCHEGVRKRVR